MKIRRTVDIITYSQRDTFQLLDCFVDNDAICSIACSSSRKYNTWLQYCNSFPKIIFNFLKNFFLCFWICTAQDVRLVVLRPWNIILDYNAVIRFLRKILISWEKKCWLCFWICFVNWVEYFFFTFKSQKSMRNMIYNREVNMIFKCLEICILRYVCFAIQDLKATN
jgi:hypothetical protein